MNIYTANQIKAWDDYTILHEPIPSIDLMERAAAKVVKWILQHFPQQQCFVLFCGNGNNGGDGLGVARMLFQSGLKVQVFLLSNSLLSSNAQENLTRLEMLNVGVERVVNPMDVGEIDKNALIVDALFGTGLSRPLQNFAATLVDIINNQPNPVISIDLPSGLPADTLAVNAHVVKAQVTLTFQRPKFSFFLHEHSRLIGRWELLDIGLHEKFEQGVFSPYRYSDFTFVKDLLPPVRDVFSHKGNFGHSVVMGGSMGMAGALTLALKACLKSGTGLVTAHTGDECVPIIQTSVPEAMCSGSEGWNQFSWFANKTAIGVGMGWKEDDFHAKKLQWLISNVEAPLLIDAGALNLLSSQIDWLTLRPKGSVTVLTPHPGELAKLGGISKSSLHQLEKAKEIASTYGVMVVLKGAYTRVITPHGLVYFNSTGNPGMAKGGSGDVLAGLLTGLLSQGLPAVSACLLGVFLHGLAGDIAAKQCSQPAMTAVDIIDSLPKAWQTLMQYEKRSPNEKELPDK